jgi:hypothetical protein
LGFKAKVDNVYTENIRRNNETKKRSLKEFNPDWEYDKIPIAPIEYAIIKKLEFCKEGQSQKHIN